VPGLLETVTVDRGDLVKEGQVLATLESKRERAAVVVARARAEMEGAIKFNKARLEFGTRKFDRNEELYKKNFIPSGELDEIETTKLLAEMSYLEARENKRLAELELERAMTEVEVRMVRSPITGAVVERLLSPGEFTNQTPILKLAQLDPLRVEAIAPVALLGTIIAGMQGEVMPEAPVNGVHRARVKAVDRMVDPASGTFGVRLGLPNPGYRLSAGLKCKVRFLSQ
jgi:RND family efflux transporter MFP subunit